MRQSEHFVDRLFVRLKEMTMTSHTDQLLSAEDHYAAACRLLADADNQPKPIAETHALLERAHCHIDAGVLATRIWTGDEPPATVAEMELGAFRSALVTADRWYEGVAGGDLAPGAAAYRDEVHKVLAQDGVEL